jgi:hypothetical protein
VIEKSVALVLLSSKKIKDPQLGIEKIFPA